MLMGGFFRRSNRNHYLLVFVLRSLASSIHVRTCTCHRNSIKKIHYYDTYRGTMGIVFSVSILCLGSGGSGGRGGRAGGVTQSVRERYKSFKGANLTVVEGMHQIFMYVLYVVQPVRRERSVWVGGGGGYICCPVFEGVGAVFELGVYGSFFSHFS